MSSSEDDTALLIDSLERTLAELEALAAIYGDDKEEGEDDTSFSILNQAGLERARNMVETQDATTNSIPELHVEISCPVQNEDGKATLCLRCCLAAGYPEVKPAVITSIHIPSTSSSSMILHPSKSVALMAELTQTAESLVGAESIMTLVETMKELAPQYCSSTNNAQPQTQQQQIIDESNQQLPPQQQELQIMIISTHHLLDHAPDNLLAKGHKYKLHGFYRFGTPGLAICVGIHISNNVEQFQAALEKKMPQKKFETIVLTSSQRPSCHLPDAVTGWTDATHNLDPVRGLLTQEEFAAILQLPGK